MLVNFDCTCFWVVDRRSLTSALSVLPHYLRNPATDSGEVIDYRDWQAPLGRRFRALKLWFTLRSFGLEAIRTMIRRHVGLAREFAARVAADERFELADDVRLNLVCFRHRGGDAINEELLNALNASGAMYVTHAELNGKLTLRWCVGQARTERRHVEAAWRRIQSTAPTLESAPGA
jgi:aromatic-L-amino-acid decarboxylase